ncbi:2-hydroxychromene-2-carboxylate isomerase [Flexibacterium corallicola]|uniref:2-hydroxychromene-2-carboxylate isomerase n=1 Tax=Flexibacterium corallicola TaxID=3037259 RepID=UPI00286EF206|nr:DsbA family protein [Pseudovibrio sp. M1P-2-3]
MQQVIDVYWSFRSPFSYLVTPDLLDLRRDYDIKIKMRILLPMAISNPERLFKKKDPKAVRYLVMDAMRRSKYLDRPMEWPRPDPVLQDFTTFEVATEQPYIFRLVKLGIEAERRGKGLDMICHVSKLIWGGTENWDQGDHLAKAIAAAGLDLEDMDAAIENGDHLEEAEDNRQALYKAGHWGIPTMIIKGEPFFGQDRIDTLRWRLDMLGLRKD